MDKSMNEIIVYHLVTNMKMELGQKLHINSNEKNTLFKHFFQKELLNKDGYDVTKVLQKNRKESGIVLKNDDANFLSFYVDHSLRTIRETIVELVRLQEFPERPSRLSCLYAAKDLTDIMKWKNLFESYNRKIMQIVKIKCNGRIFEGNADLLPKQDGKSFEYKMSEARSYWKGEVHCDLPEILVDGNMEIIEIVNDFT